MVIRAKVSSFGQIVTYLHGLSLTWHFQGDYLNDLCVLNTGSNIWTATSVVGELPEPRSDTQVRVGVLFMRARRVQSQQSSHGDRYSERCRL